MSFATTNRRRKAAQQEVFGGDLPTEEGLREAHLAKLRKVIREMHDDYNSDGFLAGHVSLPLLKELFRLERAFPGEPSYSGQDRTTSKPKPIRVYVVGADSEPALWEAFQRHLTLPVQEGLIQFMKSETDAGRQWRAIWHADLVVGLVAPATLNMVCAVAWSRKVFPIIAQPSRYQETDISRMAPLPRNERSLSECEDPEKELVEIARELTELAQSISRGVALGWG